MEVSRRAVLLAGVAGVPGAASIAGCDGRAHIDYPQLRIGTGPAGAVYRELGGAIAPMLDRQLTETAVSTVPSRASTDNIRMLLDHDVHLGLCSLDAVVSADGQPPPELAAVCRLYDSYLHLAVLADSPVRHVADLAGKRVSFGARDSGTEFTTERLVALEEVDVRAVRLDQADSAEALRTGSIDALFSLTGIPTPAISELAARRRVRFVPMTQQAGRLADTYPGPYVPATIPSTAYTGVGASPTVAVPNVLLARADLPDDVVRAVTGTIMTGARTVAARRPEARQINVRTAIATGPVPLHPGAAAWFRANKR
ncbi:hypothetical protein CLV30_101481 [Haloactinopolyspora alba]|uniref:TRAP transporter TAXI family solute receptor n=1 Tax=Haloactinopolyspora alba TaxID=648780 RepID=A0A2P8EGB2_9ACTN|nr:TAXI family TRAP transporter solute-binding subunit [Haloactinopolyspora alba]PSL08509.1 hypothetical protein CLV30_101481 [Haloactinopolyspora alba]